MRLKNVLLFLIIGISSIQFTIAQDSSLMDFGLGYYLLPNEILTMELEENNVYFTFNRLNKVGGVKSKILFSGEDSLGTYKDKKVKRINVDEKYEIELSYPDSGKTASIHIGKKRFILDSLFYGKEYEKYESIVTDVNIFGVFKIYEITYKNKNYILAYTGYMGGNNSLINIKPLVFILNASEAIFVDFGEVYQSTLSPLCFDDFNDDGELDYINWSYFSSLSADFYLLTNNGIKKTPFYLLIDNTNYWGNEKYSILPIVDMNNSEWFDKIK